MNYIRFTVVRSETNNTATGQMQLPDAIMDMLGITPGDSIVINLGLLFGSINDRERSLQGVLKRPFIDEQVDEIRDFVRLKDELVQKTSVLDLVILALQDHEKQLDNIIYRLETRYNEQLENSGS